MRVAIAVCLTLVLGASTFVGEYLLKPSMAFAPGALLVMLVFAYGWPRLTDSPQPRATSIMLAVFGGAGVVATVLAEEGPFLEWLPILVGMGFLWAFVQNLTRGLGASHATVNVSAPGRRTRHHPVRGHVGGGVPTHERPHDDPVRPRRGRPRARRHRASLAGPLHLAARHRRRNRGPV